MADRLGVKLELKLVADLSRWKADQTGNPEHIEAAVAAEEALRGHLSRQAALDAAAPGAANLRPAGPAG